MISDNVNEFVKMSLIIISDFLEKKFDEKTLSRLIHLSLLDNKIGKYHFQPYLWKINDVLALLHELLDITWTMDGIDYDNYLTELRAKLIELDLAYQGKNL